MLTDKSGRLFKSIEDCANTAIRGLLALISPEAGAMGELATSAVKMRPDAAELRSQAGKGEGAACLTAHSWAYDRVSTHHWPGCGQRA